MKKYILFVLSLIVLTMSSCKNEPKQEVYNPFVTPEGCVKEFLDAKDSIDVGRMLNCYSYEAKYERIIKEGLQKSLDDYARRKEYHPDYYYRTDSVKLKEQYPNSAVVTVYCTEGNSKDEASPWNYDMDLVRDSANWKLEAKISYSISAY